jgi:hypothetical protein
MTEFLPTTSSRPAMTNSTFVGLLALCGHNRKLLCLPSLVKGGLQE